MSQDYVTSRHGRASPPELHKHVSYEALGMPQNSVQSTEVKIATSSTVDSIAASKIVLATSVP
jgi:hypothetical protein